jgi:hypothetical protein
MSEDFNTDDLFALAEAIGGRIESGRLPRQNEFGQYVFTDADLNFPELS